MVKKSTKKHDARAKLLFCLLNLSLSFLTFSLALPSSDLKVPNNFLATVISLGG